jgi:RNA polymerase II subunit A small phosphatase-like protein
MRVIVIDLDETLVHTSHNKKNDRFQKFTFGGQQDSDRQYIAIRKGANDLFQTLNDRKWTVVLWTAGLRPYAEGIYKALKAKCSAMGEPVLWTRDRCTFLDGVYVKDLRTLVEKKLAPSVERVVLLDNSAFSALFQLSQWLPIRGYRGKVEEKPQLGAICKLIDRVTPDDDGKANLMTLISEVEGMKEYVLQCLERVTTK